MNFGKAPSFEFIAYVPIINVRPLAQTSARLMLRRIEAVLHLGDDVVLVLTNHSDKSGVVASILLETA